MAMVRKQFYIEKAQDEKLKRLAEERGATEAELIRRAIDLLAAAEDTVYRASAGGEERGVREVATLAYGADEMKTQQGEIRDAFGRRRLDREAWLDELAFIREQAERARRAGAAARAEKWDREDVYDRRRLRLPD